MKHFRNISRLAFETPNGLFALWKNSSFSKKTKIAVTALISVLFIAGVFMDDSEGVAPLDVQYTIIKETPNKHLSKNNLGIRLEGKIDVATLTKIAHSLRAERKQYDRLWVFYFLPSMDSEAGNGCWAISHFTPEGVQIEIIGSTAEEDKLTGNTENIGGEILGKWRCENSPMGTTLVMYKTLENSTITSRSEEVQEVPEGTLVMQVTHKDGSQSKEVLSATDAHGKKRYDYKNNHGEYYQLEANGNLGLYDQDGKYDEAIKIN